MPYWPPEYHSLYTDISRNHIHAFKLNSGSKIMKYLRLKSNYINSLNTY